jgi:UDP-N-acetylmuramate dehydrogenase
MKVERLKNFCLSRSIGIKLNEPMSAHTSLRIGGLSEIAIFPDEDNIREVMMVISEEGIPYISIGRGTNLLVQDGGVEGAVIFTERINKIYDIDDNANLTVQAGCSLQKVITLSAELGLSGMEGLAGIPGSVGGAIAGNAGSFGYEIKDAIDHINILTKDAAIKRVSKKDAGFKYRGSDFPDGSIIMNCCLTLKKNDAGVVKKKTMEFLNEKRLKQPLNLPSAGCVFKNPEGISAGKLIDEAGCKGMRAGGVMVSMLHANYFVNCAGGTSCDFLKLMDMVVNTVNNKFGILLEPEIKIVGRN